MGTPRALGKRGLGLRHQHEGPRAVTALGTGLKAGCCGANDTRPGGCQAGAPCGLSQAGLGSRVQAGEALPQAPAGLAPGPPLLPGRASLPVPLSHLLHLPSPGCLRSTPHPSFSRVRTPHSTQVFSLICFREAALSGHWEGAAACPLWALDPSAGSAAGWGTGPVANPAIPSDSAGLPLISSSGPAEPLIRSLCPFHVMTWVNQQTSTGRT